MKPVVTIADTRGGLAVALDSIFAPYGGVEKAVPAGSKVYVKPNGIHFSAGAYTDPTVLDALLAYLSEHGYERLAVMENSTHAVATRLVFAVNGYARIARRYGAEIVYLDEGPTVPVTLEGEETPVRISRRLYRELLDPSGRAGNFYLSLPKLKTHCMTKVTLGVKNQQAFPIDADRVEFHTRKTLHPRLARLYKLVRPDFCIIEGVTATFNGHLPPRALLVESTASLNLLVGGKDTVAVDTVGAKVLGYDTEEIEHLRLAAEWGLGEGRLDRIEVIGDLSRFRRRYPFSILRRFNRGIRIIEGREKACVEGCKGNAECALELLSNDYAGHGGFTILFGKGFAEADLEELPGDMLVVGSCAVEELAADLRQRYGDRRVIEVPGHNDLRGITAGLTALMGIKPINMVPLPARQTIWLLLQARARGLNSRLPPLFGGPARAASGSAR